MNETKNNNQLPKDWKWVKLGEVCGIVYGKGLLTKNLSKEGFPVFGANGIIGYNDKYLFEEPMVLISCRGAYSGKINFSPPKCYVTNNSLILDVRSKDVLDKNYLFYSLIAAKKNKLVTGTAQPQVTINNAIELDIPLPPKPTQLAIVSKIEELFSEIENGIKSLFTAKQQLKTYRQSVLKWAFEGKLTEMGKLSESGFTGLEDKQDGRQNKKSRKSLHPENPDSDKGELPEGWKWSQINEIGKIKGGKRLPPKHQYSEEPTEFVYIMAGNLKDGTVRNKQTFIREETFNALANYKVTGGEVYITIVGACIGDAGIIPANIGKSILTENAAKIIELKETYNKYLALWINSTVCQANIKSKILSATLGKLALNRIGTLEVPIAPIKEQYKIVQEIESRLSVADKMEESITQSLQQAEALKQSILKKAFEGKLI